LNGDDADFAETAGYGFASTLALATSQGNLGTQKRKKIKQAQKKNRNIRPLCVESSR
jgi:hypothetical protein